ncbi:MAG: hypothetical protein Q9219_005308 [cf. Caloplaca sp. 3 TL-2023]
MSQEQGGLEQGEVQEASITSAVTAESQQKKSFHKAIKDLRNAEQMVIRLREEVRQEKEARLVLANELRSMEIQVVGHDRAKEVLQDKIFKVEKLNDQLRKEVRGLKSELKESRRQLIDHKKPEEILTSSRNGKPEKEAHETGTSTADNGDVHTKSNPEAAATSFSEFNIQTDLQGNQTCPAGTASGNTIPGTSSGDLGVADHVSKVPSTPLVASSQSDCDVGHKGDNLENLKKDLQEDVQRYHSLHSKSIQETERMKYIVEDIPRLHEAVRGLKGRNHPQIDAVKTGLERLNMMKTSLQKTGPGILKAIKTTEQILQQLNDPKLLRVWQDQDSSMSSADDLEEAKQLMQGTQGETKSMHEDCNEAENALNIVRTRMQPWWKLTGIRILDLTHRKQRLCHIQSQVPTSSYDIVGQTEVRIRGTPDTSFTFDQVFGPEGGSGGHCCETITRHAWSILDRDVCFFFNHARGSSSPDAGEQGISTVGSLLIKEALDVINIFSKSDKFAGQLHLSAFRVDDDANIKDLLADRQASKYILGLHVAPVRPHESAADILSRAQRMSGGIPPDIQWGVSLTLVRNSPRPRETRLILVELNSAGSAADSRQAYDLQMLTEAWVHECSELHDAILCYELQQSIVWLLRFLSPLISGPDTKLILHTIIDESSDEEATIQALASSQISRSSVA